MAYGSASVHVLLGNCVLHPAGSLLCREAGDRSCQPVTFSADLEAAQLLTITQANVCCAHCAGLL